MPQVEANGAMLSGLIVCTVCLVGAYFDLRWRRLPNWLTLGAALGGLLLQTISSGLNGGVGSVVGWLLGCALLWLPFMLGATGAGDVKLLAAVGALRGASFVFMGFLYGALAGGVFALMMLLWRGQLLPVLGRMIGEAASVIGCLVRYRALPPLGVGLLGAGSGTSIGPGAQSGRGVRLPYGAAIAVGSLVALALGY